MDPITISIITSLATSYFSHCTAPQLQSFFEKVFRKRPLLEQDLRSANSTLDIEKVLSEALGIVEATADDGSIEIENGLIKAVRAIRFDHENGAVI